MDNHELAPGTECGVHVVSPIGVAHTWRRKEARRDGRCGELLLEVNRGDIGAGGTERVARHEDIAVAGRHLGRDGGVDGGTHALEGVEEATVDLAGRSGELGRVGGLGGEREVVEPRLDAGRVRTLDGDDDVRAIDRDVVVWGVGVVTALCDNGYIRAGASAVSSARPLSKECLVACSRPAYRVSVWMMDKSACYAVECFCLPPRDARDHRLRMQNEQDDNRHEPHGRPLGECRNQL